MPDPKDVSGIVKRVSVLGKILTAGERCSTCSYRVGHEIQTQHLTRISIKCRIGYRAYAVRHLSDRRKRTQQMRFSRRGPLRNGPKGIHHSPGRIGKFICKPPLVAEGRMGVGSESLKICDPVERSKRL